MRGPGEDAGALILAGGPYWMSFDNGVRSADGLPELTPARTQLRQDVGYPDIDNYFEVYVNEPAETVSTPASSPSSLALMAALAVGAAVCAPQCPVLC